VERLDEDGAATSRDREGSVIGKGFVARSHPFIHMDEVADLLNKSAGRDVWSTERVRRWLVRRDAATKHGRAWLTTREQLREAFPEFWREMLLLLADDDAA
jgi:hypothetical protein